MVSLFEILLQKPLWAHLNSGLLTLDTMLNLQSDAILDLQSVPSNPALSVMLCNMICSHLDKSEETSVAVIETLNDFPWQLLRQHSQFKKEWISRMTRYQFSSFSKVYAFFKLMPLQAPQGSVMFLVTNFHELIELYRYQFSATYEEYLLKHQIEKTRTLLENKEKAEAEGINLVQLPQLPEHSLLKENPFFRSMAHVHELFLLMSAWTVKNSGVVLLLGHMEPKYISARQDVSQNSSQFEDRKLTLTPVIFGEARGDKHSPSESKISAKLIFYNDWYFRSPHFKNEKRAISEDDKYLVSVVKVISAAGKNITEPIYFDYKHSGISIQADCFINLLETQNTPSGGLSSLIQESIRSTQVYSRSPDPGDLDKLSKYTMPSSPPPPEIQHEKDDDFPLVIDASDVELTGTLLDMENSSDEDAWLARH